MQNCGNNQQVLEIKIIKNEQANYEERKSSVVGSETNLQTGSNYKMVVSLDGGAIVEEVWLLDYVDWISGPNDLTLPITLILEDGTSSDNLFLVREIIKRSRLRVKKAKMNFGHFCCLLDAFSENFTLEEIEVSDVPNIDELQLSSIRESLNKKPWLKITPPFLLLNSSQESFAEPIDEKMGDYLMRIKEIVAQPLGSVSTMDQLTAYSKLLKILKDFDGEKAGILKSIRKNLESSSEHEKILAKKAEKDYEEFCKTERIITKASDRILEVPNPVTAALTSVSQSSPPGIKEFSIQVFQETTKSEETPTICLKVDGDIGLMQPELLIGIMNKIEQKTLQSSTSQRKRLILKENTADIIKIGQCFEKLCALLKNLPISDFELELDNEEIKELSDSSLAAMEKTAVIGKLILPQTLRDFVSKKWKTEYTFLLQFKGEDDCISKIDQNHLDAEIKSIENNDLGPSKFVEVKNGIERDIESEFKGRVWDPEKELDATQNKLLFEKYLDKTLLEVKNLFSALETFINSLHFKRLFFNLKLFNESIKNAPVNNKAMEKFKDLQKFKEKLVKYARTLSFIQQTKAIIDDLVRTLFFVSDHEEETLFVIDEMLCKFRDSVLSITWDDSITKPVFQENLIHSLSGYFSLPCMKQTAAQKKKELELDELESLNGFAKTANVSILPITYFEPENAPESCERFKSVDKRNCIVKKTEGMGNFNPSIHIERFVQLSTQLKCDNVLGLKKIVYDTNNETALIIFPQALDNLRDFMLRNLGRVGMEIWIMEVIKGCGKGMITLHENNIILRNVNPRNLLVYIGAFGYKVQYVDFEFARMDDGPRFPKTITDGDWPEADRIFFPPECQNRSTLHNADKQSDVWMLGRTLFHVLFELKPENSGWEAIPFEERENDGMTAKAKRIWKQRFQFSLKDRAEELYNLIIRMLKKEKQERISSSDFKIEFDNIWEKKNNQVSNLKLPEQSKTDGFEKKRQLSMDLL